MAIPKHLCYDEDATYFAMVSADLLSSSQFQSLSHAARMFYIVCATHKETPEQINCLRNSLKEYHKLAGIAITEDDLDDMAGVRDNKKRKRSKITSSYFVIPEKHLKQYGYSSSYANKLKKQLIENGFIKIFANEKKHSTGQQGSNRDFSKRVTIYQFTNSWKHK